MSNLFLESLGEAEYDALRPYLEKIELPDRLILHRGGETIEHCYFPVRGTSVCELVGLADGSEVEAGIVGREGFAGVTALLPGSIAPNMFIVQIPGAAMRIKAKILREQAKRRPALLERILFFSVALGVQVSQTAVCNARHNLSERLARWLLMLQDRAERDELPLTHDILSTMLGVRRSGVTVAAGGLSERGAIRYTRGLVTSSIDSSSRRHRASAIAECASGSGCFSARTRPSPEGRCVFVPTSCSCRDISGAPYVWPWLAKEGGLARAARYFPTPRPELSQILATSDALLHREMHRNPCYFRRGHVLVRAGEPVDTVYRLLTGSVARVRYMPDGRRQIISFSTPGDLLPARAVLLQNLPDSSVVLANSAMDSLDCRAAIKLAIEHPEVAFRLMWQISEDERRLRNNLMMLAKGSAKERVAAMIADIHGRLTLAAGPQERHKIISLRQQDIADYLGLTLVHVNRVLRSLREEGVIEVATGAIGVRDLSRIVEYATPMLDIDELATPEFVSGTPA